MNVRVMLSKLFLLIAFVRGFFFKSKINACGRRLLIMKNFHSNLKNSEIAFGNNVRIFSNVKISALGGTTKARLFVGNNVSIGTNTEIHCGCSVYIGDSTLISWGVCIMDRDYHKYCSDVEQMKPVHIGEHVWIGHNVIIGRGVTIGDNCVIAPESVVTKNIPSGCLAGGNPARIIKEKVSWNA